MGGANNTTEVDVPILLLVLAKDRIIKSACARRRVVITTNQLRRLKSGSVLTNELP
jgi:hypothetical protein